MLVTVTNLSSTLALNDFDSITSSGTNLTGPAALLATGGNRTRRLPYPFGDQVIAASGTLQRVVHPRDFRNRSAIGFSTFEASDGWNRLAQQGLASFTIAAESTRRDPEELFITAV